MRIDKDNTHNEERRLRLRDREQMTFGMVFSSSQQVRLTEYGI